MGASDASGVSSSPAAAGALQGGTLSTPAGAALGKGATATDEQVAPGSLDLTREAAYNLALLYQQSGAPALVRQVYAKYLTIV
jgi:hypothetical protein